MDHLHLDFETRSPLDLTECGLHNYASHPETQVVLMAYAFDDGAVKLWSPYKNPDMPRDVAEALNDPFVTKLAWNATFERAILKFVLKIDVPISEFSDPMVNSRYLSMPGYLEDVGSILKLNEEQLKMAAEGLKFIKLFTIAAAKGGENTLWGVSVPGYLDWNTNPDDWKQFEEYVKRDVIAERVIAKKVSKHPLPPFEQAAWCVDQRINERGIPCDLDLARGAQFIASKEAAILKTKLKELTALENPNSNDQMLSWVQTQGYIFSSLGKPFVNRALGGEGDLTPLAREVLEIRRMTSKTSVNKFNAILAAVGSDGRLRHQFSFLGAQRTGRWSGRSATGTGVQLQNLSKPVKSVEKNMDRAIELIKAMDYDAIVREFGQPLEVASSVIRAAFKAELGKKLLICDLAAIEARLAAWLTGCEIMLGVFRDGQDIYKAFAAIMYRKPYDEVTKEERNLAKPAVLGACYQLGVGEEIVTESGDRIKTGLLGYAAAMGIEMSPEQAKQAIEAYRTEYKEIPAYWYALENAAIAAIRGKGPQTVGYITFECIGKSMMRVRLPSGRYLHYLEPEINKREIILKHKTITKDEISYMGVDQQTRQWVRQHTRGGHLFENLCQAVARDILLNGILLAEENNLPVVAHVHDEIISEVADDPSITWVALADCMKTVPNWAPGLPLDASGFESIYYKKD